MFSVRQLDARSVVLEPAACAGMLLLMSQASPGLNTNMRVQCGSHPRVTVLIDEGVPYVVPPGRIFVLTGL